MRPEWLACLLLTGCATCPPQVVSGCGLPPPALHYRLSGDEYIRRAQAWESFALCLRSLLPEQPVEVKLTPFEMEFRDILERREWSVPNRRGIQARARAPQRPIGAAPYLPIPCPKYPAQARRISRNSLCQSSHSS